jgi:hypothetical protein
MPLKEVCRVPGLNRPTSFWFFGSFLIKELQSRLVAFGLIVVVGVNMILARIDLPREVVRLDLWVLLMYACELGHKEFRHLDQELV